MTDIPLRDQNVSECWFHGDEPVTGETFIVCFECGHVWTRAALEEANYQGQVESASGPLFFPDDEPFVPVRKAAEDIFFCPECIHDF